MTFDQALNRVEAASSPTLDPKCTACGFDLHCHGPYSRICPVLVKGMLSQFRAAKGATVTQRAARPISYTSQVWQGAPQTHVKWSDDLKAMECTLHHVQLISVEGSSEWFPCSVCELEELK